ncbi:hypothetical protein V474_11830 [Novosphingobium barchaimii LL02]|nr:UPF0149 family protein [Novosphingobium barchaimii]KMS52505.1 hypothetical protein V474_23280 [Novosphingobium barchaimii LL02]KMS52529.1 hypothetical protein V474_23450 [Novosphingobium barchaimii LL02]KMS52739.1 hypothetical protein V474_24670 [Novosphingobium barchaimii LL02]KMS52744.1 hypothetical protein V474_24695 [Novosphingobium barchaimii LL02]KMS54194.1 hypothetical protein V474_20790 [Novosphingobium barchaimii LL02]
MNFKPRTSQGRTLSLEQLEIWLDELDPPVAGVSSIDGFLAAVAAGPSVIDPDVWIKSILREHALNARSAPARRTILKRYNRICIELAEKPEAYAPIYMRTEEGEVLLEDFANGFFTAMHLDMEAWKPFIADPQFGYPLAALLGHSTITGGPSWIEQLGDPSANLALVDTWRMVPQIISLINDQCAFARMTPAA